MRVNRRTFIAGSAAAVAVPTQVLAQAGMIRIGEINSYTAQPAFLRPYRNGWELAIEQVNAAGGVLGRKLETVFRDDGGKPEDAVRLAGDLINAERVDILAGGCTSLLNPCPMPSSGARATATPSGCVLLPTCRRRCWWKKPPS
jgi:branched-chain amino acid transport system substrate-binding protein